MPVDSTEYMRDANAREEATGLQSWSYHHVEFKATSRKVSWLPAYSKYPWTGRLCIVKKDGVHSDDE